MRTTNCNQQFKVRVHCATFNHAQYITDAMNGFVMQKTEFPYICTIMDDCSTDKEWSVIKQYLQKYFDLNDKGIVKNEETDDYIMTFARHKTNHNCFFAVYFLKYNHYSINKGFRKDEYCKDFVEFIPYIALCEGDDYWTDPLKLQKQVDILEKKHSVSLVYTAFQTVDNRGNDIYRENYEKFMKRSYSGNNLPELFNMNYILTCTVAYRKELLKTREYKEGSRFDYGLFLAAASYGDFCYITDKTASYRLNPNSLTATKNPIVAQGIFSSYKYYASLFLEGLPKVQSYEDELLCARNILKQSKLHGFIHLELGILKKYKMLREGNILHYIYLYLKCLIKKQTI